MIGLFGISSQNPAKVVAEYLIPYATAKKLSLKFAAPIPDDLPQPADIICCLSIAFLAKHLTVLGAPHGKFIKSTIIVFDIPANLALVANLTILKNLKEIGKVLDDNRKKAIQIVRPFIRQDDTVRKVLKENESAGFLNDYNTTIYLITNKQTRETVRDLIEARLQGKITLAKFNADIDEQMPTRPGKSLDAITSLKNLVNSPIGVKMEGALKEAFAKRLKGTDDQATDEIAARHGVVAYDIRYFLARAGKASGSGKNREQAEPAPKSKPKPKKGS